MSACTTSHVCDAGDEDVVVRAEHGTRRSWCRQQAASGSREGAFHHLSHQNNAMRRSRTCPSSPSRCLPASTCHPRQPQSQPVDITSLLDRAFPFSRFYISPISLHEDDSSLMIHIFPVVVRQRKQKYYCTIDFAGLSLFWFAMTLISTGLIVLHEQVIYFHLFDFCMLVSTGTDYKLQIRSDARTLRLTHTSAHIR